MATRYRFLTSAQVKRLYISGIGNAQPTQPGLLDSAVASPINNKNYGQENLFQLAAILSEKIVKNHAFQDGNKRTALLAADMFLKINGYVLQQTPLAPDTNNDGITEAHVKVATGSWSAIELASYYESIVTPLVGSPQDVVGYRNGAELY
ncbi:hypothetical protein AJ78_06062 [Neofusicoccum parvum]|uniref:Uncharacterized protein n=1 Tax=Neofusicoccum parvum TaxID=310453 RepID=A0ACB5SCF2_9PEZI|nr:hypothetical protein AJ78_06062 [Neofusicoccum parvum]